MNHFKLIIDFDSTFVKVETLDILAEVCFEKEADKISKINAITDITKKAMNGDIPFDKALKKRIKILKANKTEVHKTLTIIKNNISESFKRNQKFFKENANNCFIVSGGFREIILPIVKPYGFKDKNVFGNNFIYKNDGTIFAINGDNPLSQEFGKIKISNHINQNKSTSNKHKISIILGDGYTDYEVNKYGKADYFIQFVENINRKSLNNKADAIAENFDDVIKFIDKINEK